MINKKHILFLLPQLNIGGTERHLIKLVNKLSLLHDVTVFCFSSKTNTSKLMENNLNSNVNLVYSKLTFPYFHFILKLVYLKLSFKIDFIHSFNYKDVKWDVLIKMFFYNAVLITERRNIQHWRINNNLTFFEKVRNNITTKIIANCMACMDVAVKIEKFHNIELQVIYNSVSQPVNHLGHPLEDKFKIISVANIKEIKNQMELIVAFHRIDIPNKELYLVGNCDSAYSKYLFEYITSNSIENIHFVGQLQNPEIIFNSTNLYVSTSKAEGLSNAILEALSFGLPVVASNVGGNIEIIKNGYNGFIYNLGDVEDLCTKIMITYNYFLEKTNLSDNCKNVIFDFSEDKMLDNYLRLYK